MTRTKNTPRVNHGGCWNNRGPLWVRVRNTVMPAFRDDDIGFRTSLPARQPR